MKVTEQAKPCPCCLQPHELLTIRRWEAAFWDGERVLYKAEYYWCENDNAYFTDAAMKQKNNMSMIRAILATDLKNVREGFDEGSVDIDLSSMGTSNMESYQMLRLSRQNGPKKRKHPHIKVNEEKNDTKKE